MRTALLAAVVVALLPSWGQAGERLDALAPACGRAPERCLELVLHVAVDADGAPVASADWLAAQFAEAARLFAPLDVGFRVRAVESLPTEVASVVTRADRDALGRSRAASGALHVFVVERLADVDEAGEWLNGVHWRLRADRRRCWIIVARTAWPLTLGHELGHHFGLPHSTHPGSVMFKGPANTTPAAERVFAAPELAVLKRTVAAALRKRRAGCAVNGRSRGSRGTVRRRRTSPSARASRRAPSRARRRPRAR